MSNKARIKELREKQAREHEAAKSEWDKVKDDTPDGEREAAKQRFNAAMSQHDKHDEEIVMLERLDKAEERMNGQRDRAKEEERAQRRPDNGGGGTSGGGNDDEKVDMRAAFSKLLRRGHSALSEKELEAYHAEEARGLSLTPQEREERALSVGTDSAGGYTVPTIFRDQIEKTLASWGPMMDGAVIDLMPTDTGAGMEWPTINDTASRGGLVAENADAVDDAGNDLAFGTATLSAYLYSSEIMRVSRQLLMDSAFDFENRLIPELFGERMARTGNDVLTTGDGSSKPQGIVAGAGAGLTAAATGAIADDEVIKLQHTVNPAYRNNPTVGFMFNDTTLQALRLLKDAEDRYIWQRPNMETGAPAMLLDKRYWINQSMANIGAGTVPMIFGDMKKYLVRQVRGWELFVYRELFMPKKQIGFEVFGRIDGKVVNTAAIKKLTMAAS